MNNLERFKAICMGQEPDYYPIFAFPGAPGMSLGCLKDAHDHLLATGMPSHVGGSIDLGNLTDVRMESWTRYWGTTGPVDCMSSRGRGAKGIKWSRRIEGEFEIVESEAGSITRQFLNNGATYGMPEFVQYAVRDRPSWEFYRDRVTPTAHVSLDEVREHVKQFANRDRPLRISPGGTYGFLRDLIGPEQLSILFYEDPELIHDIMDWQLSRLREDTFPIIEIARPEIVKFGEDLCYNHGMLLSPALFDEFCGPIYRETCDLAKASGVLTVGIDTDGNIMQFTEVAHDYGADHISPCEVKSNNDLFELRRRFPEFIFLGWLEKETVNEGNEAGIEPEIMGKVPEMLKLGRYFPNGDHALQPMVTFPNLCKFMTLLHEVCRNPEGEFPRVR